MLPASNPPEPDSLPLIIRFSASIPDLFLDIATPDTTTSAGLKQLIRTRLPSDLSAHRLRLICAGRGLEDDTALTTSLRLPPRTARPNSDEGKGKGKGKEPIREKPRLYIHCSIGDIILTESDLADEAATASTLLRKQDGSADEEHESKEKERLQASMTTPAPRGFDRLLTAGFTAAEVTALRSQFMAVQSVSRTPDTMPSGSELRELEDRWLDEGTTAGSTATGGAGEDGAGNGSASFADDEGGFGAGSQGAIDDMLWGAVMGFFWPIGCAMWLRREEGVWSWRKGLAVFVGVVVNAAFGLMRMMN